MGCIYQYVNKINGHMYIGFTMQQPERRFSDHLSASFNPNHKDYNQIIHKAIRKYGINNFNINILEDNLKTMEECKKREKYWIEFYDTYKNREHYNQTPGGDVPGYNTAHLGEEHYNAKLTKEQVQFCRKAYQEGKRSRDIYNLLNLNNIISYTGFLKMWHGQTWKHIMPEVFENNPHPGKYNKTDKDNITKLYKESGLNLTEFCKTKECYVGYGTLWKMINTPEFYNEK